MTSLAVPPPSARAASGSSSSTAETAATTRLFEAHSERILAYCLRRLGSRAEAEDAVQVTFLYAFRALQRGVVPESESAWLLAIAKNACRWQQRTLSRRGALSSEHDLDGFAGPPTLDGDDAAELCRDLKEALKAIPASQRRALVLREWHGLPASEIAARLELSIEATYALLTRARRSFMVAYAARREALSSLQLGTLVYQLRHFLKGLFGAASTKAAVLAVAVAGAGVGGAVVAADELRGSSTAPPVGPVSSAVDRADVGTSSAVSQSPLSSSASTPGTGDRPAGGTATGGSPTFAGEPPEQISAPALAPEAPFVPGRGPEAPQTGTDAPTTTPTSELPPVAVESPPLPGLELPEDPLPPVELPPLPLVDELPPAPDLPLPEEPLPEVPVPEVPVPEVPVPELPVPTPRLPLP